MERLQKAVAQFIVGRLGLHLTAAMRRALALMICSVLAGQPALAATADQTGLAAGKPAGVKAAQDSRQLTIIAIAAGAAVLALGVGLAVGPKLNTGSATSTSP